MGRVNNNMNRTGYYIIAGVCCLWLLATCQKVSRAATSVVGSETMGAYTSAMNLRFKNQTAHIRRTSPVEGQTITGGPLTLASMLEVRGTVTATQFVGDIDIDGGTY